MTTTEKLDGRIRRRINNEKAAIAAAIALISEGAEPSATAIEKRCGVSYRTVYRIVERGGHATVLDWVRAQLADMEAPTIDVKTSWYAIRVEGALVPIVTVEP